MGVNQESSKSSGSGQGRQTHRKQVSFLLSPETNVSRRGEWH